MTSPTLTLAGERGSAAGQAAALVSAGLAGRYGDEFLAMVEDTLDGRGPGWRLQLSVAWSGLRQRGRRRSRRR